MNRYIQTANPRREEKGPARLLLEKLLGPERVRDAVPAKLIRARTAQATARDLLGNELGESALLEVDAAGNPLRLFIMNGQHNDGDTLLVDSALGRHLVTVSKTEKGLDGKGYIFAGGNASVLALMLESAMPVSGEAKEDEFSWGDVEHEEEFRSIRDALEGKASALTLEEVLRGTFRLNEGSEVRGVTLFGENTEVEGGTIKVRDDTGREKLYDALRIMGFFKAFLVRGNIARLADLGPRYINSEKNPDAFTAEMGGTRYAGILVSEKAEGTQ